VTETLRLSGFVNAHSHTFQRTLRGRAAGGDFWAWRDGMLAEADRQTPDLVRESYASVYDEMLAAGYTAVGEFHYIGVEEARAAAAAAERAGIAFVLLHVAYGRGGIDRFRQPSVEAYLGDVESLRADGIAVGLAPHSVRACPREWLVEIGHYAATEDLPLHVHADEQPREIEECLAEHGMTPIELLADTGCLTQRTTIVHATHASDRELDLVAEHRASVCVCPTTEADLGDGFVPALSLLDRGVPVCIGSDSNVRIDPLEELRELEGIARRESGRRGIFSPAALLEYGSRCGAASLGIDEWPPVEIDLQHRSLAGIALEHVPAALVAGCGADVVSRSR
jgi:formimidoylglutamate deiminase